MKSFLGFEGRKDSEAHKNHVGGRFERVTGLSLPHLKLKPS